MSENGHILVADDDYEDLIILSGSFKEIGKEVRIHHAVDGVKAIEYLHSIEIISLLPSLIILDLNMPKINGTDTLRQIRQNNQYDNIPVVIFSTSVNDREKEECMKLGATDYITKPTRHQESLKIAQYLFELQVKNRS